MLEREQRELLRIIPEGTPERWSLGLVLLGLAGLITSLGFAAA